MRKRGKAECTVHFVPCLAFAKASNRPYINVLNVNSLWSTFSRQIAFACLPNVRRIAECCLPCLGNTSTLNDRFVFACCIRILFAFRCKLGCTPVVHNLDTSLHQIYDCVRIFTPLITVTTSSAYPIALSFRSRVLIPYTVEKVTIHLFVGSLSQLLLLHFCIGMSSGCSHILAYSLST